MPITDSNIEDIIDGVLDDIADEIFSGSQENIIKNKTSDEGTLLKTGNVVRKRLEKTIVYPVSYADSIEYGTDPHWVDSNELEGWVNRKLGYSGKRVKQVAVLVAKKIAKYGTRQQPFVRPAIDAFLAKRAIL